MLRKCSSEAAERSTKAPERVASLRFATRIVLNPTGEQRARLEALQAAFASVCNAVAEVAVTQRCFHRVALHHLSYRMIRAQFPLIGSQMACNAIYSVARFMRLLCQHPQSPLLGSRWLTASLPRVVFGPHCPVYFDRHTLSIKGRRLSMFTLDGRMKFEGDIDASVADLFTSEAKKLREIVLLLDPQRNFMLHFHWAPTEAELDPWVWPTYVVVQPQLSRVIDNFQSASAHGDAVAGGQRAIQAVVGKAPTPHEPCLGADAPVLVDLSLRNEGFGEGVEL